MPTASIIIIIIIIIFSMNMIENDDEDDGDDDDDDDDDDALSGSWRALAWSVLVRPARFPRCMRPSVPVPWSGSSRPLRV